MFKIKHTRTADCVLAGFRWHKTSTEQSPLVGSLLLGLYNEDGALQHVGVVGAFTAKRRAELVDELEPLLLRDGDEHPGSAGPRPKRIRVSGCPATSRAGTHRRICRSCRCVRSGCSR